MNARNIFTLLALVYFLIGCSTTQTFNTKALAGNTVAIPVGMVTGVTRQNLTVDFNGGTVYLPGEPVANPVVRAVVNLYPDPLSKLVVGGETGEDYGIFADIYASSLENSLANFDKEWWNTVVFLDLPDDLPLGINTIDMTAGAQPLNQAEIEIIAAGGAPNPFSTNEGGDLTPSHLANMERAPYYTVSFVNSTGSTVPYAIEVQLQHDNSGSGVTHVVNPRGDIKNVSWDDNLGDIKVILIPTHGPLGRLLHFKFYVTGNITGLQVIDTKSYDINGNLITTEQIDAVVTQSI